MKLRREDKIKEVDLSAFDFDEFKIEELAQSKSEQLLTGKDRVLTPLIKSLLEVALEGEKVAHMSVCEEVGLCNRRNGKSVKTMKAVTRK